MTLISDDQAERVHVRDKARAWRRSGFIDQAALTHFERETETGFQRTNIFFRALLFVFTTLCGWAVLGLIGWMFDLNSSIELAILFSLAVVPFYWLAEFMVRRIHLYRHGIEEALAVNAVALVVVAVFFWCEPLRLQSDVVVIIMCGLIAAGSAWLRFRFGFLYAYFFSIAAIGVIPFQFSLPGIAERAALFLILGFFLALNVRRDESNAALFRKADNTLIQAVLFLGMYLSVNLRILDFLGSFSSFLMRRAYYGVGSTLSGFTPATYYVTYALIWMLPLIALRFGLWRRKRAFVDAGLLTLLMTLLANKDYLGKPRHAWDGAVLGVFLIAAALAAIRYLSNAAREKRSGLTSKNLLKPENHGLELAAAGAAVFAPSYDQPAKPASFEGGASGGAGANRDF